MILADKIINLRKKNGMSQEDLANKLDVSRQSVSKWEGAQSIPDLDKIISMSKIFGVSTDYLLKDEMEEEEHIEVDESLEVVRVSMKDANNYLDVINNTKGNITLGVVLCILSPVLLITLSGFASVGIGDRILPASIVAIGIVVLFLLVAFAVFLFVSNGMKLSEYEYLIKVVFETEYGVTGLVNEKKSKYSNTYKRSITIGIILCILSVIPLLVLSFIDDGSYSIYGVSILLFIVAIGVGLMVNSGIKMSAYNVLLQEKEYNVKEKPKNNAVDAISGAYWLIALAIYLGWSLPKKNWDISWIVWVIAGILFPAFIAIVKAFIKEK